MRPLGQASRLCRALGAMILICTFQAPLPAAARGDANLSVHPAQRAAMVSAIGITVPALINAAEGAPLSITATAGSGDPHSLITITLSGAPPGLTFATNTPTAILPWANISGSLGYQTAGVWQLRWHAFDQFGATDDDTTRLVIADTPTNLTLEARAFTLGGDRTVRLWTHLPSWCIRLEPVAEAFPLSQVDIASVTVSDARVYGWEVSASVDEASIGADRDGNGVPEITACIAGPNVRLLFLFDDGSVDVPILVGGRLLNGDTFRAESSVRVIRRPGVHVRVSPNPVNPVGMLSISIVEAGPMRVRLFDVAGRLVRVISDADWVTEGMHSFPLDGRDSVGRKLRSGVYLLRVETPAGVIGGRVAIVR